MTTNKDLMKEIKEIQRKQQYHDNQIDNAIRFAGKLLEIVERIGQMQGKINSPIWESWEGKGGTTK